MEGNAANDRLYGGGGADFLDGSSENDKLFGGAGEDVLYGGLVIASGVDTLNGGAGSDTMIGGNGADVFVFDAAIGPDAVDFMNGYEAGIDIMHLDNDIFTALGPIGALAAGKFRLGTAAEDANDRIIYNSLNGRIWYDADGVGGTVKIAFGLIVPGTVLTAGDFLVIQ
jgi:Ca2+-binding RTX toxin-like protein